MLPADLVSRQSVVAAAHGADSQVVGSFRICETHRELGLQQGVFRCPVYRHADVDPVVGGTVGQDDTLYQVRLSVVTFHFQHGTQLSALLDADLYVTIYLDGIRVYDLFQNFPGGPLRRGILREEGQSERFAVLHQLFAVALVDQRADIAVGIKRNPVDVVFDAVFRGFDLAAACTGRSYVVDAVADRFHRGCKSNFGHAVLAG